jgi:hypothetical protein
MVVILGLMAGLAYPFKAKIFPLIALLTALVLLIIQIFQELFAPNKKGAGEQGEAERIGPKHLVIGAWVVGAPLMLWVFGFMGTVILFPFLYLRFQRESWPISIFLPICCGVFFYLFFDLALGLPLYRGVLFSKIF